MGIDGAGKINSNRGVGKELSVIFNVKPHIWVGMIFICGQ